MTTCGIDLAMVDKAKEIILAVNTLCQVEDSEVLALLRNAPHRRLFAETLGAWRPDLEESVETALANLKELDDSNRF